jgi:hypothetical protein
VALSKELAQVHLSDDDGYGRAIVCETDPVVVLYRLSERLGLPWCRSGLTGESQN